MKMMNSVPAGVAGTIVEVCAEDAQLVADGEPLFRVEARDRDRRHHHPRRQPEPLGCDRPDHAGRARDRPGDGPRRLPRARLHLQHAHGGVGPLPPRGPLGAHPAGQRRRCRTPRSTSSRPGMRFISWVPAGEDVIRLSSGSPCATASGASRSPIRRTTRTAVRLARMAREEGADEVVVGLTYSISPAHTHEYYAERAAAVAGCEDIDRLYLKDPGGLLTAGRRARAGAAVHRGGRAAAGRAAQPLHDRAGAAGLRGGPAGGLPDAAHRRRRRWPTARRTRPPRPRCATSRPRASRIGSTSTRWPVSEHFRALARDRGCRSARPPSTTPPTTATRCRAAWSPPRSRQLEEMRRPELFDAALEEVTRVRAEMGYPIMVTPSPSSWSPRP